MRGQVVGQQPGIGVVFRLPNQPDVEIEFVIDTGFEGALTLPVAAVDALQLPFYQRMRANLADNSGLMVDVYRATILWHGQVRAVAVLALGNRPLLGTSLLVGNDLYIHFEAGGEVSINSY